MDKKQSIKSLIEVLELLDCLFLLEIEHLLHLKSIFFFLNLAWISILIMGIRISKKVSFCSISSLQSFMQKLDVVSKLFESI